MKKDTDVSRFDKRIAERLMERGVLTAEEYKQFMDKLPDSVKKAERFSVEFNRGKQVTNNG